MGYEPNIIRRAARRLDQARESRKADLDRRRDAVYDTLPQVREIDAKLRGTVAGAIAAALNHGQDPGDAIEALRQENLALQAQRDALLKGAGIDPASLEEAPACPLCRDVGWVKGGMCTCLKELCVREQVEELSKLLDLKDQRFDSFRLDYYPNTPGPNGRPIRQVMEQVLEAAKSYAARFGQPGSVKNLYLSGKPGLGKTFLSACIARQVAENGFSVVYDTAANVFAQFETKKFSRDAEDSQEARDETYRYLNCDLLILDDLGTEFTTPFVISALYTIINTRLAGEKATVISSNLSLAEMESRYSPQVASRLLGEYRPLPFLGEDIRRLKKQGT